MPQPAMDYEGQLEGKKLAGWATRFIMSNVIQVSTQNVHTFINDSPSVPKVLLFTDKKNIPIMFKALSVAFENKLFFGIVKAEDTEMMKKYNVKTFPKILVVKATERKPVVYEGEINYQSIFDFVNIYSETFVSGGGSSQDSAASKQWLSEVLPELHQKSIGDICLNLEGYLCVVTFNEGKPEGELKEQLIKLANKFSSKVQRGSNYKFMWVDTNQEKQWKQVFDINTTPTLIILNPGRRKRYVTHQGQITYDNIINTMEKINSGDSRFISVKGQALPELSIREKK